jgi:2-desacetyl-2-hydroxyethyl bacteriochlorophyllide A dehydrogenase
VKTIVLKEPHQFQLADTPLPPPPGQDEVQVRVRRVGICGTDLHAFTGTQPFFTYPRILGHELAVEVVAIGARSSEYDLEIGDLCCIRPYLNCGTCAACMRGNTNCCLHLQVLGVHQDGGMREIINVPIDKLHPSKTLTAEELALVEMLSIGCHAVQRAQIVPGEVVLVIGMGPIGLGVSQFAHLAGARVLVMDISDARLSFAAHQNGIEQCIDAKDDVVAQINSIIPDDLPSVVFDATGNAKSMMQAFQYVGQAGRLVFVGLFQGEVSFFDPEFHRREATLLASRNATAQDFQQVMEALETKKIDVKPWITHFSSAERMVEDFSNWLDPDNQVIKAMLSF